MRFLQMLEKFDRAAKMFANFIRAGALKMIKRANGGVSYDINPNVRLTHEERHVILRMQNDISSMLEAIILGNAIEFGPKIFIPDRVDLQALSEMRLNITMEDYVQPFETIIVEVPSNYRAVPCEQDGETVHNVPMPSMHRPCFVTLYLRKDLGFIGSVVMFDSELSIKSAIVPSPDETFEVYFDRAVQQKVFDGSLACNDDEWEVVRTVTKAAMNYALLIDEFGCKPPQAARPADLLRAERHLKNSKRSGDPAWIERSTRELVRQPYFYSINQHVKLYKTVERDDELSEETGRTVRPHRRRGFYQFHWVGPERKERKRIRHPPVFVNRHKFLGDERDTIYTAE